MRRCTPVFLFCCSWLQRKRLCKESIKKRRTFVPTINQNNEKPITENSVSICEEKSAPEKKHRKIFLARGPFLSGKKNKKKKQTNGLKKKKKKTRKKKNEKKKRKTPPLPPPPP